MTVALKEAVRGNDFVNVYSGPNHSMGITAAGQVYTWGANTMYQLGYPGAEQASCMCVCVVVSVCMHMYGVCVYVLYIYRVCVYVHVSAWVLGAAQVRCMHVCVCVCVCVWLCVYPAYVVYTNILALNR